MDIITERVMLSEITKEDAPFMFQLLNSPKWIQFIGDRNIQTLENAVDYIENIIRKSYATHGFGFYKIQRNFTPLFKFSLGFQNKFGEIYDNVVIGTRVI